MKMKIFVVVVLLSVLTCSAYPQDNRPPNGPPDGPPRDGLKMPSPEEMAKKDMQMLTEELGLTNGQIPFVKKILEDSYKKMQSNFEKGPQGFDEMNKVMEEKDENLKLVLTDEQWIKYKDLKSKRKDKMKPGDSFHDKN
jgi:hypothetical protein